MFGALPGTTNQDIVLDPIGRAVSVTPGAYTGTGTGTAHSPTRRSKSSQNIAWHCTRLCLRLRLACA